MKIIINKSSWNNILNCVYVFEISIFFFFLNTTLQHDVTAKRLLAAETNVRLHIDPHLKWCLYFLNKNTSRCLQKIECFTVTCAAILSVSHDNETTMCGGHMIAPK